MKNRPEEQRKLHLFSIKKFTGFFLSLKKIKVLDYIHKDIVLPGLDTLNFTLDITDAI